MRVIARPSSPCSTGISLFAGLCLGGVAILLGQFFETLALAGVLTLARVFSALAGRLTLAMAAPETDLDISIINSS